MDGDLCQLAVAGIGKNGRGKQAGAEHYGCMTFHGESLFNLPQVIR